MEKEERKPHHLPKAGVKAKKKQQQNLKKKGKTEVKQSNVKVRNLRIIEMTFHINRQVINFIRDIYQGQMYLKHKEEI